MAPRIFCLTVPKLRAGWISRNFESADMPGPGVASEMPTSQQVTALIRSHFEGDSERFVSVALQIAAHEAKLGHSSFAHSIRRFVDDARRTPSKPSTAASSRDLGELLSQRKPTERLSDLVVSDELRERIKRILDEYRQREKLRQFGLANRRRILLAGEPGTGKTMTAAVIAGEVSLPLHTVMMHRLVTKYMGETAAKLRQIFDIIGDRPGIYLFDEFDAIGAQRGREHEVGEMRRVLNSFLQFIEHDESDSMIIAATNTFDVLDTALFRRFDDVLHYQLPNAEERTSLVRNRLGRFLPTRIDTSKIADAAASLSHAEITRACDDAIKRAVLDNRSRVSVRHLIEVLEHRKEIYAKSGG